MLIINTAIVFALGVYFLTSLAALGGFVQRYITRFQQVSIQELLVNTGIAMAIWMLVTHFLAMTSLLYPLIIWIIFIGFGVAIWYNQSYLKLRKDYIVTLLQEFSFEKAMTDRRVWVTLGFILLSVVYYYYGFAMSYIPYSTAWDANHAYMYYPKVWAENHSMFVAGQQIGGYMLWYSYVTFWFTLMQPLKNRFWIGPDTIAVAMNFLSALFVIIFGLPLIQQFIGWLSTKWTKTTEEISPLLTWTGWTVLLLWLTSGMGAFLVFVDNKTDLGVMGVTILAMLSGFIFINKIIAHKGTHKSESVISRESLKYVLSSGFLFTIAIMAKATAFLDVAGFALFLTAIWLGFVLFVGVFLFVAGLLIQAQILNTADFYQKSDAWYAIVPGLILSLIDVARIFLKKQFVYLTYVAIWALGIVVSVVVLKLPQNIYSYVSSVDRPSVLNMFLSEAAPTPKPTENKIPTLGAKVAMTGTGAAAALMADTSNVFPTLATQKVTAPVQCTMAKLGLTDDTLFTGLLEVQGGAVAEDVGRYVGYGQMGFSSLLMTMWFPDGCSGWNRDAVRLCVHKDDINNFNVTALTALLPQLHGQAADLLSGILNSAKVKDYIFVDGKPKNVLEFADETKSLTDYYTDKSFFKTDTGVLVPYRYVVPLNIAMNRSLQNLSSYYTDIGYMWVIIYVLLIVGLIYGVVTRDRQLISITGVTIGLWAIWWMIGGGILWYGIGLVVWSGLSVLALVRSLYHHTREEDQGRFWLIIAMLSFFAVVQLAFNLVRISSQGAGGPFVWYKENTGRITVYDDTLQPTQKTKAGYKQQDVFDLQFPYYNKFINATANRDDKDGVLIAGTYLQYFLKNQANLTFDGLLSTFWQWTSDEDLCKTYLRLQEKHIKYLVIDPNIGTVVMGGGNETLFDRFFAKTSAVDGSIEQDGSITALVKMYQAGYLDLFSTNNLAAKYAFTLPDSVLEKYVAGGSGMTADQIVLLRSKLVALRFFPNSDQFIQLVGSALVDRMKTADALGDLADVMGVTIDESKLKNVAIGILGTPKNDDATIQQNISQLTNDERMVLSQYLGAMQAMTSSPTQFQNFIQSLLGQSIGGSSQIMIFELK